MVGLGRSWFIAFCSGLISNDFAEIGKRLLLLHMNGGGVLERGVMVLRSNWYFEGVLATAGNGGLDGLAIPLFFGDVDEI
jgi:hypothetical protein